MRYRRRYSHNALSAGETPASFQTSTKWKSACLEKNSSLRSFVLAQPSFARYLWAAPTVADAVVLDEH